MNRKQHQVIAVEKGVKSRQYKFINDAYKLFQKPSFFNGFFKTFEKRNEDEEDFPDEKQLVQQQVEQLLQDIAEHNIEYWDIVAAKDHANCIAKADVVVNGETLLENVPATHLLFLEKQLSDMQAAIDSLPVLDPAYDWTLDPSSSLHKSEPTQTTKTKKVEEPLVLYPATPEHPAQTQVKTVDRVVGTWKTTRQSGAVTASRKKVLSKRVRELVKAVKYAREEANEAEAPEKRVGERLFNYLLAE